jgi:NADH:ubiquinone oxidoreductase subunit 2 (subunit N)
MKALLVAVLVIVGVLAAVVAVVYFVEPVHSLPSFFPGHAHVGTGHRNKRGAAAAVVAVVLWVIAIVVGMTGRRRSKAWR